MNVANLIKLYEVGLRILRERLPIGFGTVDCGSFACLLGWTRRLHPEMEPFPCTSLWSDADQLLGLTGSQADRLFDIADKDANIPGPAAYAELERRMAYLANLIREAGGTVPSNYTGLPDSIREIFDGNVPALALRQAG